MSRALPRRGLAALAATATLGAACVTPIVNSATAETPPPVTQQRDGVISVVLGLITGVTNPATVQGILTTFGITTPALLGDLLAAASPTQLATLLDTLTPQQLDDAVANLTSGELLGLLNGALPEDLANLFTLVDPLQLAGVL